MTFRFRTCLDSWHFVSSKCVACLVLFWIILSMGLNLFPGDQYVLLFALHMTMPKCCIMIISETRKSCTGETIHHDNHIQLLRDNFSLGRWFTWFIYRCYSLFSHNSALLSLFMTYFGNTMESWTNACQEQEQELLTIRKLLVLWANVCPLLVLLCFVFICFGFFLISFSHHGVIWFLID